MSEFLIVLKRTNKQVRSEDRIVLGEPVFDVANQCLLIGDGTGSAQKVAEIVIGPHDENAYAKLDRHEKLIPIGFLNIRYNQG